MRLVLMIATSALGVGSAVAAPVIAVSGRYDVGVTPATFAGASNPLGIDGVVPDAPGAISTGHIDAFASVAGTVLSFQHDQFGFGAGEGTTTTRIDQTFTNAAPGSVRVRFDTTILAGVIGLAAAVRSGDDLVSTSPFPVGTLDLLAELDFGIMVDGVSLYGATAQLESGGGGVSETLGGSFLALRNLTRSETLGQIFYSWDNTDLTFDLGLVGPGGSRSVSYVLSTTTFTDSLCFWRVEGCGVAQVSFGDPRSGGGVIFLSGPGTGEFGFSRSESDIVTFAVPAPAPLGLLGVGAAALLVRRRRALP
jgi:hypothetical protein